MQNNSQSTHTQMGVEHHMHHTDNSLHSTYPALEAYTIVIIFVLIGIWYLRRIGEQTFSNKAHSWRFDLFRIPGLENLVKWRFFSYFIRSIPAFLFITVLVTGFWGNTRTSFAAPFTWLFWWTLLIVFVAFAGKIFCAACPWDFFANLFEFGWIKRKKITSQSVNLKWPRFLANIYLASGLFIVLTWLELGYGITKSSYITAWLGLGFIALIIVCALLFERRSFCRFGCPIGRISGVYSQFSPLELRVKNKSTCNTCTDHACVRGTDQSTPCPTFQIPYRLRENTYCTLCTECIRSCDKNNLTIKMRPLGTDLYNAKTARSDEVLLTVIIFVLTFFHGLTMTPTWFDWTSKFSLKFDLIYIQSFTILMAALLGAGFLFFSNFIKLIQVRYRLPKISAGLIMSFIPLVLGYHLGHNFMHLFEELTNLVPLINDPFGRNWNIWGWQNFQPFPLIEHKVIKYLQFFAIIIGFWYSAKTLRSRIEQIAPTKSTATALYLSHYIVLISMGILALWFVYQPMAMRSGF
ncbi:MAG: 4Fe-4S binding protein [Bdellovibrionota bacterium]